MEDSKITIDAAGRRITICPICNDEILLADDELAGDTVMCDLCETPLMLIDQVMFELDEKLYKLIEWVVNTYGCSKDEAIRSVERKLLELKK